MQSQSQEMPRNQVINELMKMLDNICQNAGYLRYFQNQYALVDTKIYFDICQIIFSQLSIKLIKIQQYQGLDEGEKLDCLINLITNQLCINMPGLSGKQIIKFHISHIYEFLSLLLEYSKLYFQRGSGAIQPSVKTEPNQVADDIHNRDRNPFSARPPGIVQYSPRSSDQRAHKHNFKENSKNHRNIHEKNPNFQKTKANKAEQNSDKLQQYPQQKNKKSGKLFDQLVKVVIQQKNRANKSSLRDQRKNKNVDLQQAKNKYKQYLKSYTKQKKADNQRKNIKKKKQQQKQSKQNLRQLPLKDFENIDNFFKSFNYKLRDLKDVYVRKIQKQVRQKQRERTNFKARKQRQTKQLLQKLVQIQVDCLNNEHHIRKSAIQQQCAILEQQIKIDQKQLKRKTSTQKKIQKSIKKNDLQNIQNLIRQENQKVLMQLEQGGRLQRLIMSAYQKF